MTVERENIILKAIAKSPCSMMEAARIAGIPYREFLRSAIHLGIYKQNKVVLAAAATKHAMHAGSSGDRWYSLYAL